MKNKINLLLIATVIIASHACKRERNFTPGTTPSNHTNYKAAPANNLSELESRSMPRKQSFIIDASQDQTITGEKGSQVAIPKGSLLLNGKPLLDGTVLVEMRELADKSNMISCGITTQTANNILETAGMIEFNASIPTTSAVNPGSGLTIDSKNPLVLTLPMKNGASGNGYEAFYLNASKLWVPAGDSAFVINKAGYNYMRMPVRKCGWINCDRFYHYNPSHDIRVKVDSMFRDSCKVYVVVHYLRSAVQLYWDYKNAEFNVSCHGYSGFPDTASCTVIVEYMKNGHFYEKHTEIKPQKGLILNLEPDVTDYEVFSDYLKRIFDQG